ncbi:MAG: peptidase S58 [Deltaproteobacteria bacterium CG2_30_63_29]|nr:MAG: peptidase S58 [Deltaproteobacteria bacterium CG2_30_63_29]PJB46861.1 MAG: peptidase S58 [Deltaproteobacteria bacterium CG_4_9_14_3_um_filter_63_12]
MEQNTSSKRVRLRDLGITVGRYPTGPFNAITDVPGVMVGHSTIIEGKGPLRVGVGPIRTGVTAIMPNGGNIFAERVIGGAFVLNGAGEMSGLIQVLEWGIIETPILLTNTLSVGTVSAATNEYFSGKYPGIGNEHDVLIPLVGECDDSFLNDIAGQHVQAHHVFEALDSAASGPVAEGAVGGGVGMIAYDLKAGIGTSSRVLPEEFGGYTLGILVNSNCGRLEDLRVDGIPVGEILGPEFAEKEKRESLAGSIIVVLATNAPVSSRQVTRLCTRVALGIGRTGSFAAHGSGEIIIGFSTVNTLPRNSNAPHHTVTLLNPRMVDPLYRAAVECTEEAILNSMCMANTLEGVNGRIVEALPLERVAELYRDARAALYKKSSLVV